MDTEWVDDDICIHTELNLESRGNFLQKLYEFAKAFSSVHNSFLFTATQIGIQHNFQQSPAAHYSKGGQIHALAHGINSLLHRVSGACSCRNEKCQTACVLHGFLASLSDLS